MANGKADHHSSELAEARRAKQRHSAYVYLLHTQRRPWKTSRRSHQDGHQ